MPSKIPGLDLEEKKKQIDNAFFLPLEKLRLKYESSNLAFPFGKKNETISYASTNKKEEKKITRADLINAESELGRTLFGVIPAGHQREFFKDEGNIWIWHESWEVFGTPRGITIRYDVRKDGVYKKLPGKSYEKISGAELENFRKATHAYLKIVKETLY